LNAKDIKLLAAAAAAGTRLKSRVLEGFGSFVPSLSSLSSSPNQNTAAQSKPGQNNPKLLTAAHRKTLESRRQNRPHQHAARGGGCRRHLPGAVRRRTGRGGGGGAQVPAAQGPGDAEGRPQLGASGEEGAILLQLERHRGGGGGGGGGEGRGCDRCGRGGGRQRVLRHRAHQPSDRGLPLGTRPACLD